MAERRAAIVTGASRGIGKAVAEQLGALGMGVVINYNQSAAAALEVARIVKEAGGGAVTVQADVADLDDHPRLVEAALEAFGGVDVLVNNAGVAPTVRTDLLEATPESYDRVMSINLRGPYFLTQRVARVMVDWRANGRPAAPMIINIASLSSYAASPTRGEYCLSKAALSMMTALFADRLAEHGINVYEVRPGVIETDMTGSVREKYDRLIAAGLTPIQRWGKPGEVALAVRALVEGYFPFSTGLVIDVDGGFHLRRL